MSYSEFVEWVAFNNVEPGEPYRTDLRFAKMTAEIVAAVSRSSRIKIADYVLDIDKKPSQKTSKESRKDVRAKIYQWASSHNASLAKGSPKNVE